MKNSGAYMESVYDRNSLMRLYLFSRLMKILIQRSSAYLRVTGLENRD
jgi:hypothetical protein